MSTAGVGAVVDLPGLSVIVRGLDAWTHRGATIDEPRLLAELQNQLGPVLTELRSAPWDPDDANNGFASRGVPVTTFPRWLRCPVCSRLGSIDSSDQFKLIHRFGRRPDLAKWVHTGCAKQAGRAVTSLRACVPARFLVVCDQGHLDEFPYDVFVHKGAPHSGMQLEMRDSGSTLGPNVLIRCLTCSAVRSVAEAAGQRGAAELPACRGRHPHLQMFETCGLRLRLMVLGASNLWFNVSATALHLPIGPDLAVKVSDQWSLLSGVGAKTFLSTLLGAAPQLKPLRDEPLDAVWDAIQDKRTALASGENIAAEPMGLEVAEWQALSRPTTQEKDEDFKAEPEPVPIGFGTLLDQVVLVKRLREVQALVAFARVSAPAAGDLRPDNGVPLKEGSLTWAPATERRGEGIFLQLQEEPLATWATSVRDHPRIVALAAAYRRWLTNRGRPSDPDFPIPRYLLLHTLSHLLIRQVSLDCGYSSASIRERIYVGTADAPAAGILLSTAASDSEGTLGGLVALGERQLLGDILTGALEAAQSCSSDPLCGSRLPSPPSDALNAAACHACLYASETSCAAGNRWLDRSVLVDITGDGIAYPAALLT